MDQHSYRYAEPISSVRIYPTPKEPLLETASGRALLLLALVAIFAIVGGFDYADKLAAEAKAKQERAARIAAYVDMHKSTLSHPLPYDATVTQSGPGIEKPVTSHYFVKHEGKR